MNKLSIEELKEMREMAEVGLQRRTLLALDELITIRELKGDWVPVADRTSEECSPDVYAKGVSACLVDIPKEKAEVICRGISAASGVAVDWHYIGGRVHIKTMRFPAPQKPVISKEKLCDWLEDNFDIDDSQRDAFAQCFAHHCNCIVKKENE